MSGVVQDPPFDVSAFMARRVRIERRRWGWFGTEPTEGWEVLVIDSRPGPGTYMIKKAVRERPIQESKMKNEWPLTEPDQFNPNQRAYPFTDGEIAPYIHVDDHSVKFVGQTGPIKEVGVNGCQIDDLIKFARRTIEIFNAKFPCRENAIVITKLQEAEFWLEERKTQRSQRGVEGYNKE